MKNEELITMLAYLAYRKRKTNTRPEECLNIYVKNQKLNARFSNKGQITNVLGEISRNNDEIFSDAISDVNDFVLKLQVLTGEEFERFNELLAHTKKNTQSKTNQNFYLLWIILNSIDTNKVKNEKDRIFSFICSMFRECQDIHEDFDVDNFIQRLSNI
jgi:hypothetical protein